MSLQAFISHEIAWYLGKYAKARPLCQAKRYAPSGVKSAVRYPLQMLWFCYPYGRVLLSENVIMRIIIDQFFMIKLFLTAINTINRGL